MPEFICKECGKKYKREFYYKKHMKEKHGIDVDEVIDKEDNQKTEDVDKVKEEKDKKNIKKELGQFYTKNYNYILQNINIPENTKNIVEPFAGEGDLIKYINEYDNTYNIIMYDINPKKDNVIEQDTLLNPPKYKNKFVITNPPYLARNKSDNKEIYDKYNSNDLYKCFIISIINDHCRGGILIIPLNFISSTRTTDISLRGKFLSIYSIIQLNIFEEQVFSDTSYTVCSLLFNKKTSINNNIDINIDIYPSEINFKTKLTKENNYTIGGEIYNLDKNNNYKIKRLTTKNLSEKNTNIVIKCIDDNSKSMICANYVNNENKLFIDKTPNLSARSYLTLIVNPSINEDKQKKLVNDFNNYLSKNREKYNSLFLTNYRESNDIARKRISFDLVYKIIGHLID